MAVSWACQWGEPLPNVYSGVVAFGRPEGDGIQFLQKKWYAGHKRVQGSVTAVTEGYTFFSATRSALPLCIVRWSNAESMASAPILIGGHMTVCRCERIGLLLANLSEVRGGTQPYGEPREGAVIGLFLCYAVPAPASGLISRAG